MLNGLESPNTDNLAAVATESDIDQIKRVLQDHLKPGIVLIIGSGLSCAEGLPSMGALVTHMDQAASTKSWEGADATDWPAVIDAIRSNGLEPALKSLMVSDEIAKFIRCEIAACVKEKEAIALREILTGARMLRLSRLMPHLPQDNRFSVITTNYDRLVEVAAECTGFLVDTRSRGNHLAPFSRTDGAFAYVKNVQTIKGGIRKVEERVISLYKPHGSLDWTDCNGSPMRSSFDLGTENTLIITPGKDKYRAGYNQPFDLHRELANQAIDRAERLMIIGYGFNDDHLETHLDAKIKSGTQTLIMAHKLTDNARDYLSTNTAVWGLEAAAHPANGTLVHNNGKSLFLQDQGIWDTGEFVKGVLEP